MSKRNEILYISYDGMTDQLGQSQVLPYLAGLSQRGFSITLLSAEKADRFEKHGSFIRNLCKTAGIDWHPVEYTARPPVVSTLRDVFKIQSKALRLHKKKRFAVVHCRSYIAALIGLRLKKVYGVSFLFDMRGFWADERVDGGLWNLRSLVYKRIYNYFKKKEKLFLNQADHVISLTEAAALEMSKWEGVRQPLPVTVIPCCVDTGLFDPDTVSETDKSLWRKRLDIEEGQLVVGYIGSIGTWYLLKEMLEYFQQVLEQHPEAVMLFVTNEPAELIEQESRRSGVPAAAIRITSASRQEMPVVIDLFHHSVFFIKPSYSKMASSPTKQGELMSMGVPVVCNTSVGDTDTVVSRYQSGVVVKSFSSESYRRAFVEVQTTGWDRLQIRSGAIEFYSLEKGVTLYASVYNQLIPEDEQ